MTAAGAPDPAVFGTVHHDDVLHGHDRYMTDHPPVDEEGYHEHMHIHPGDTAGRAHRHRHEMSEADERVETC